MTLLTTSAPPSLERLIAQARLNARKRGQTLLSTHLLPVLARADDEVRRHLEEAGIGDIELLGMLASPASDEAPNVLPLAMERATTLAAERGELKPRAIHVLMALLRDPRSAAHRALSSLGTEGLRVQSLLGEPSPKLASRSLRSSVVVTMGAAPSRPAPKGRFSEREVVEHELRLKEQRQKRERSKVVEVRPSRRRVKTDHSFSDLQRPSSAKRRDVDAAAALVGDVHDSCVDVAALPLASRDPLHEARKVSLLGRIGRDLTQLVREGKLDPVFGRSVEVQQILDVLRLKRAANPLLVGPSGVGKTALVHAVAHHVASLAADRARSDSSQDRSLSPLTIIEVAAGALVQGAGVRGALATRFRQIETELAQMGERAVLFIDDIHILFGAAEGPDDLGTEFKAALRRGGIGCIGATTDVEFTRCFERDASLARRFTRVDVGETDESTSRLILNGLAPSYGQHHGVTYGGDALEAAIAYSKRYLPYQHLPEKAISLFDIAGARAQRLGQTTVSREQVAQAVAERTSIPVQRILCSDKQLYASLHEHLADRVIGQSRAIASVARVLRKAALGFRSARPLGTFLFLGPTGVGKTELAKAIAETLFPAHGFTRIDLSEYSEAHSVARLLGAPPGYVGHESGGQLTEPIRQRPYQLVLLDEFEKAHPDVLLALLPLLDEGRLTDARGRTIDATHTVIVMTSNLGIKSQLTRSVGFGAERREFVARFDGEGVMAMAKSAMPPELWNRIDEVLCFEPLARETLHAIALRAVENVAELCRREHGVALTWQGAVIDCIVETTLNESELGARPIRRAVARLVEGPLADALLRGAATQCGALKLVCKGADVVIERERSAKPSARSSSRRASPTAAL